MKISGTYKCGHKGVYEVFGKQSERAGKAEWYFSTFSCPECWEKEKEEQRKAEQEAALQKSKDYDLPELSGTEKQVAWAMKLRVDFIEWVEKERDNNLRRCKNASEEKKLEFINQVDAAVAYGVRKYKEARFWIDMRDDWVGTFQKFLKEKESERNMPKDVKRELLEEEKQLIVSPEEKRKAGVVTIGIEDGTISAKYDKDDDFNQTVRRLGYRWWDFCWRKTLAGYKRDAADRMAELGNQLLLEGFTVKFPSVEIKDKAVAADYEPEKSRWIVKPVGKENLSAQWEERNDTLYTAAKKIPGAKWENGGMAIPIERYAEAMEFAETFGFALTQKAMEAIGEQKKREEMFAVEKIKKSLKEDEVDDEERLREHLTGTGIIEDLRDDDAE